jgi:hypothetical protein
MKTVLWFATVFVLLLFLLVMSAIKLKIDHEAAMSDKPPPPRYFHSKREALAALGPAITNEIVGIRCIISQSLLNENQIPKNWEASALVEFFNRQGGVERRALQFKAGSQSLWAPRPVWLLDDHLRKEAAARAKDLARQIVRNNYSLQAGLKIRESSLEIQSAEDKRAAVTGATPDNSLTEKWLSEAQEMLFNYSWSNQLLWSEFEQNKLAAGDLFDAEIPPFSDPLKMGKIH